MTHTEAILRIEQQLRINVETACARAAASAAALGWCSDVLAALRQTDAGAAMRVLPDLSVALLTGKGRAEVTGCLKRQPHVYITAHETEVWVHEHLPPGLADAPKRMVIFCEMET